jgi:hypothetical protein
VLGISRSDTDNIDVPHVHALVPWAVCRKRGAISSAAIELTTQATPIFTCEYASGKSPSVTQWAPS